MRLQIQTSFFVLFAFLLFCFSLSAENRNYKGFIADHLKITSNNPVFLTTKKATTTTCPDNLLANAGFEESDTTYTPWFNTPADSNNISISNDAIEGNSALKISSGEISCINQTIPVEGGMKYTASAWLKQSSSWSNIHFDFRNGNSNIYTTSGLGLSGDNTYQELFLSRIAPANATFMEVRICRNSWGNIDLLIDDCCVIASDPCDPDTIAPYFFYCPPDISLMTNSAEEVVYWNSNPTVADDCSVTLTSDFSSGDFFPVGVTTVTYTAEDPSGNTNTCDFEVEVITGPAGSVDLLLTNFIMPDTIEKGKDYVFFIDVVNTGDSIVPASSEIDIDIRKNSTIRGLGNVELPALEIGTTTVEIPVFIPYNLSADIEYIVRVEIDAPNGIDEINEVNNKLEVDKFVYKYTSPCLHEFPVGQELDCVERVSYGELRAVTSLVDSSGLHYFEHLINEEGELVYSNPIADPNISPNYAIENGMLFELDFFNEPIDSTMLPPDLMAQGDLQDEVLLFDNGYIFLNLNTGEDTLTIIKTDNLFNILNSTLITTYNRFHELESLVELTADRFAFVYNRKSSSRERCYLVVLNSDLGIISSTKISDAEGNSAPLANLHQNECGLWVLTREDSSEDDWGGASHDESTRRISYSSFSNDEFSLIKEYIIVNNREESPSSDGYTNKWIFRSREFKGIDTEGNELKAYRSYEIVYYEDDPPITYNYLEEVLYLTDRASPGGTIWSEDLQPAIAWPFMELIKNCNRYFLFSENNYLDVGCFNNSIVSAGIEIPYNGIDDDCDLSTLDDDLDGDGFLLSEDCDDTDPTIGSTEIPYNGIDDDCNPLTLDDDLDQDGFGVSEDCDDNNPLVNNGNVEVSYNGLDDDCDELTLDDDLDQDGFGVSEDCDDNNSLVNNGNVEVPYNGLDDDCDETTLDDDLDQDGFVLSEDCDDNDPFVNPNAIEIPYNDIDDDCNELTADDDADQDGFNLAEDCDDENPLINPDAVELPYNGLDDDCDDLTLDDDLDQDGFLLADDCDDNNPLANPTGTEIPYNGIDDDCDLLSLDDDLDQDGFLLADDCNDTNPLVNPGAIEIPYNGINEDCDDLTLDDDLDQDGFVLADDCDDNNPLVNSEVAEIPYNGIDDDCNVLTFDDDLDQDGFLLADDCDDENAEITPAAIEIPNNGIDENCDGEDAIVSVKNAIVFQPKIFPNPTSDLLRVVFPTKVNGTYEILDIKGKLIFQGLLDKETSLDLEAQPQGVYMLLLKIKEGVYVERVVKL